MRTAWHAAWLVAVSSLLATGCDGGSDNQTAGQKLDAAIARTEKAGGETLAKTREFAADARGQIQSGELGQQLKSTGAAISSTVEDVATTARIQAMLKSDAEFRSSQIGVETQDSTVTLKGNVSSLAISQRAEQLA